MLVAVLLLQWKYQRMEEQLVAGNINSIDGTITWSYSWTPGSNGTYTIYARGVDDSGNIGNAVSINITVGAGGDVTPPSIHPYHQ